MFSEYTIYTLHAQYATYVFPIYSLYIAHTDSQLYFDKYKICIQNKCALCTLYTVACTYGSHTELRSARNFEAHGTSKRTELRSARNFETH